MVNEEHSAQLRKSVQVWNEWKLNNRNIIPDLKGDKSTRRLRLCIY